MDNGRQRTNRGNENEGRINQLVNLVEKSTRTQRHLEEHSDISSSAENIQHVMELQKERKEEIDNLKNIITNSDYNRRNKHKENTEKRFLYTEGYLNNNADRMDSKSFENAKKRQEHRKEQLDSFS